MSRNNRWLVRIGTRIFQWGHQPKGVGGANILFGKFFPKTAWKWRELDRGVLLCRSASACCTTKAIEFCRRVESSLSVSEGKTFHNSVPSKGWLSKSRSSASATPSTYQDTSPFKMKNGGLGMAFPPFLWIVSSFIYAELTRIKYFQSEMNYVIRKILNRGYQ